MYSNKILIKKYESTKQIEEFFNTFARKHKIINKEIKIIQFQTRLLYFLILEY